MDIYTGITLVIVTGILLFSIAVSMGLQYKLDELYQKIQSYLDRFSIMTVITVSLVIGAVILAVVASM